MNRIEEYVRMYCRSARIWGEEQEAMVMGYRLLSQHSASSLDDLLPEPRWKQVASRLALRAPVWGGSGAERSRAYQRLNRCAEYRERIDARVDKMRPYVEDTGYLLRLVDYSCQREDSLDAYERI